LQPSSVSDYVSESRTQYGPITSSEVYYSARPSRARHALRGQARTGQRPAETDAGAPTPPSPLGGRARRACAARATRRAPRLGRARAPPPRAPPRPWQSESCAASCRRWPRGPAARAPRQAVGRKWLRGQGAHRAPEHREDRGGVNDENEPELLGVVRLPIPRPRGDSALRRDCEGSGREMQPVAQRTPYLQRW
jgi:hypothetical protein